MRITLNSIIITIVTSGLSLNVSTGNAQSRYNLSYEPKFGQNFAAENFNAGFHAFDYLDSLLIPKNISSSKDSSSEVLNSCYRFGKLFLTNYLFTDYVMTMNHERFGHGYRMLEANGTIEEIVYNLPPPFTGLFSYIELNAPSSFTIQQDLMVDLGGSETNLVLTDLTRKNILLEERFSYNYALAYLYGSNDMPGYTAFVSDPNSDPNQYRQVINTLYGGSLLRQEKMSVYSILSIFTDPLNFYALKSVFYDYVLKGKHSTKIGMIKLGDRLKYLPRFRFEYTPYGPELVYQNYFKLDSKLMLFSLSHSDPVMPNSWRFAADIWNIKLHENFSFNLNGQLWNQPIIEFYQNDKLITKDGLGGQFISTLYYDISKKEQIYGFTLQLGYKSTGYTLGEQLYKGFLIRGGVTFKLGDNDQ